MIKMVKLVKLVKWSKSQIYKVFAFTINSKTNVAVGDSVTFSTLKNAPVVGVRTNTNVIEVGSGNTASAQIMPGTAVTFTRAGTASTIFNVAQGTLIVVAGISSSP